MTYTKKQSQVLGEFLIDRLYAHGIRHIFGVPGDFVLGFFKQIEQSKIQIINTCDEQGAGYAADAYARLNGLGVVCITYCVGGLKVANTTAEAFAEKSPVIIISGAPGLNERRKNPMLHHKVKTFETQQNVFNELCHSTVSLEDPKTAASEIDVAIENALRYKQPVYIEIPRDMARATIPVQRRVKSKGLVSDLDCLKEGLEEVIEKINQSKKPVILAGVEIHRFALQDTVLKIAEKYKIPVAATILGKSVIGESHPLYLGVYEGGVGHEKVRVYVESADCLLMLGAYQSDMNMGVFTAKINPKMLISASFEKLAVQHHVYPHVMLADVLEGLASSRKIKKKGLKTVPNPKKPTIFKPKKQKMTVDRLFHCINSHLRDDMIVIADVGDSLFGALDLYISTRTEFLSPAYYTSIGFSVPASVGAQCARKKLRPLVIVGDGAFQMTGMELSTACRYGLNPIVILLNNEGYGTERPILDGKFNDIFNWNYHKLPEFLGQGKSCLAKNEEEFFQSLNSAILDKSTFQLIEVVLDRWDFSAPLKALTSGLSNNV